jgi:hypothetical protein
MDPDRRAARALGMREGASVSMSDAPEVIESVVRARQVATPTQLNRLRDTTLEMLRKKGFDPNGNMTFDQNVAIRPGKVDQPSRLPYLAEEEAARDLYKHLMETSRWKDVR